MRLNVAAGTPVGVGVFVSVALICNPPKR